MSYIYQSAKDTAADNVVFDGIFHHGKILKMGRYKTNNRDLSVLRKNIFLRNEPLTNNIGFYK
jgi:hypothetical protein